MKLFSYQREEALGIGVETDQDSYDLSKAFTIYQKAKGIRTPVALDFLQVLIEMGYCSEEMIGQVLEDAWVRSKQQEILLKEEYAIRLPVMRPSKILCLGRNFKSHAKELDHDVPEEPLFFSKAPSSLVPHEADIVIPHWLDGRVDHEAELALIIGRQGKNIPENEAMSFVAGYTILNDVTARSMQKKDTSENKPWFRSKSLDTFCPTGPYVVPADSVEDPNAMEIRLTVNGEERQKAGTSSMIFKIPEIIAYLSKFMTLQPADVIATGTPAGVSPLQDGDIIEITITGLGTLRNRVVKESHAAESAT